MTQASGCIESPDCLVGLLEAALAEADRRGNLPVAAHVAHALDLATRNQEDQDGE